ncbi:hypothetical protein Q4540_07050 [Pseudoalteromonas carrageenovora]|uniref:hypothetical protein n=1 Tax=Pseudoalteromonas TaxID=53246 RepID=UPI0026E33000|nr:hypothetical protein [Pseudoalteromonas carrageenovora]MDO6635582.1 hypothetical protein [Pseudoalteromonas carrageenovora]MDO6648248.1 hypothetical protein [Pseudoalteromonas carrageenovora]
MNYIIVSDIFGLTPALTKLSDAIMAKTVIIEPYDGKSQPYDTEQHYYDKFIKNSSHDNYAAKVKNVFDELDSPTVCIAFSAGASAAWRAQLLTGNPHLKKLIGFYPSQIRNNLDVNATIPCEFIFPQNEPHFNVDDIINSLALKVGVKCSKTTFLHGFMNQYSVNFNTTAFDEYIHYINSAKAC